MEAREPAGGESDPMNVSRRATGIDSLRSAEAAAEATVILALVLAPTGWRAMDPQLAVILTGMFLVLTAVVYGLHAVTFDYFRLTNRRPAVDVPVDAADRLNRTAPASRMPG
jgi:hypothetical protein